ncbi:MAG: pyrroline-5-carboxylate reductase [Deltaproteobacteria bacterium]|nr:pyrroline-5-carboxylate reductase [Deltaproteobacteria bacterium]
MKPTRIAFIGGAGRIGSAIIDGLLAAKTFRPGQILITARHPDSLALWRKRGLRCTVRNAEAVRQAAIVILCVHPEQVAEVVQEIAGVLTHRQLLLSVVTGLSTATLEEIVGQELRIVRAMPNTPVMVRQSMTCLARGRHATARDLEIAQRIFAAVGEVALLDEHYMDAATGLGGCGPAFAFKIIEALTEGGIKVGLARTVARKVAAQVLKGAAELVLRTGIHPAELKEQVATPAGCTIDGLAKLEEHGLSIALIDAVETATRKATQLFRSGGPEEKILDK